MNQRKLIVRVFLPLASLLQLFSCFDIMNMCFLSHFYFCSFPQTLVPPPPPPLRLFVSCSRVWVGLFFLLSLWCFYRPQSCLRLSNPIWVFLFSFCLEEIINYHNPLCCLSLIRLCNGVICFTSFCLSSSFFYNLSLFNLLTCVEKQHLACFSVELSSGVTRNEYRKRQIRSSEKPLPPKCFVSANAIKKNKKKTASQAAVKLN